MNLLGYGIINLPQYTLPFQRLEAFSINGYFTTLPRNWLKLCSQLRSVTVNSFFDLKIDPDLLTNHPSLESISFFCNGILNFPNPRTFCSYDTIKRISLQLENEENIKQFTILNKLLSTSFTIKNDPRNTINLENIIKTIDNTSRLDIFLKNSNDLEKSSRIIDILLVKYEDNFDSLNIDHRFETYPYKYFNDYSKRSILFIKNVMNH